MNIIFLDVDGVLNSINNLLKIPDRSHKSYSGYNYPFDYDCLENLKELIHATNSKIVISSSWRLSQKGMEILFETLKKYGLDQFVIGQTPYLGFSRGVEIKEFLLNFEYNGNINYIILDDDNDMDDLEEYLIQTNIRTGLTHENVEQAINMLEQNKEKNLR